MENTNEQSKNNKTLKKLTILGVVALTIVGVVWMTQSLSERKEETTANLVENFMPQEEGIVMLVEFADFQCPACGAYYPLVVQLKEDFGDSLIVEFKNFPLKQIHKNAELSAKAGEAARLQNKFSEMEDLLYTHQKEWSDLSSSEAESLFNNYAEFIGLDMEKFTEDIKSDQVRDKVNDDYMEGIQLGVRGTPTFFINGQKINNPPGYDQFKQLITSALEK